MDGATWTQVEKIAAAIDSSQDKGGGMVVLNTWDPEEFDDLHTELVGISTEQRSPLFGEDGKGRVFEFSGDDPESIHWAIQLCLCPH